jgi:hypothetical protein
VLGGPRLPVAHRLPHRTWCLERCSTHKQQLGASEDMTPSDMTFDYKVSSFLCLHNNKTKNLLLPNIGISNVLKNNGADII